jgi:hypothetical protein
MGVPQEHFLEELRMSKLSLQEPTKMLQRKDSNRLDQVKTPKLITQCAVKKFYNFGSLLHEMLLREL